MHRLVLEFEEKVIKENMISYKDAETSCVNHEEVLTAFYQNDPLNNTKELMKNIRNKFSHNEYPDAGMFKEMIKSDSANTSIAKKFLKIATQYYKTDTVSD